MAVLRFLFTSIAPHKQSNTRGSDWFRSISRNFWINLPRPGIDASGEREHGLQSALGQEIRRMPAANSVVAIDDNLGFRISFEFPPSLRQFVHRNQHAV